MKNQTKQQLKYKYNDCRIDNIETIKCEKCQSEELDLFCGTHKEVYRVICRDCNYDKNIEETNYTIDLKRLK
jgi:hypothetical protein